MYSLLLLRLTTDEFADSIGFILPPASLRRVLQHSADVRRLGAALRYGQVTGKDIREFVGQLLREFRPGELFHHDIALAALAVAMEHLSSSFAEEYLIDLARLQRPEFRASFRIARVCLKARYEFPKTLMKTSRYPQGKVATTASSHYIRIMPRRQSEGDKTRSRWLKYSEVSHARG